MTYQRRLLMILLVIGVATTGCVYWRLLKFKHQLDDFHENFAFQSDSTYTLVSRHPLLSGGDIDGIMEVEPTERATRGGLEWRDYAFAKEPPDGSPPLVYRFGFEDDLLERIEFPTQFTLLYPDTMLTSLLASLGQADVDKGERSARARLMREQLATSLPDRRRLAAVLGPPVERDSSETGERWIYRYRLDTTTQGKAERKRRARGEFVFGPNGDLLSLEAALGRHALSFDVEAARAADDRKE